MKSESTWALRQPGPFTADMVREGDEYELSNGHPIWCAPAGGSHGSGTTSSALVLGTDPAVDRAGMDVGYSPKKNQLRAPDLSVGNVPDKPGWVPGTPRLAVEYADVGQDELDLTNKVRDLLEAGTEQVWVVRLVGPRRVEVRRSDGTANLYASGEYIHAPGILARPVLVESLFDQDLAREAALNNLLARHGYDGLEAVRDEARQEGHLDAARAALRAVLRARAFVLSAEGERRVEGCADPETLRRWTERAVNATALDEVFQD